MTPTQRAVLEALRAEPRYPYQLYPVICPNGKYLTQRDAGSMGGGPSRTEVAVNFYMRKGKMAEWTRREQIKNDDGDPVAQGRYHITPDGRIALNARIL